MTFLENSAVLTKPVCFSIFFTMFLMQFGVGFKLARFSLSLEGQNYAAVLILSTTAILMSFFEYLVASILLTSILLEYIEDCKEVLRNQLNGPEKHEKLLWAYEKIKLSMEFPLLFFFTACQATLLLTIYLLLTQKKGKSFLLVIILITDWDYATIYI